jgi:hypothetical protein
MRNDLKKNKRRARQPYARPLLTRVRLVAEEAVLQGCKSPGYGPGPDRPNCKHPGPPISSCYAQTT